MIEWLSAAELTQHLRGYPPIGLWLRDWFHARSDVDPRSTIRAPAERQLDDGLGELDVWTGLLDGTPFAIRSAPDFVGSFGLELRLPVRRDGDRALLHVFAQLCPQLPVWRNPYFDSLPIESGFAVVDAKNEPIYTSAARDDAAAVAAFVNQSQSSQLHVIAVGASAPRWLVVGPDTGPYVSWLDSTMSEDAARRLAARWAAQTGAMFDVRPHL